MKTTCVSCYLRLRGVRGCLGHSVGHTVWKSFLPVSFVRYRFKIIFMAKRKWLCGLACVLIVVRDWIVLGAYLSCITWCTEQTVAGRVEWVLRHHGGCRQIGSSQSRLHVIGH